MAKSQQHGNREARKPKKDKTAAKPVPITGSLVKQAESSNTKPKTKG